MITRPARRLAFFGRLRGLARGDGGCRRLRRLARGDGGCRHLRWRRRRLRPLALCDVFCVFRGRLYYFLQICRNPSKIISQLINWESVRFPGSKWRFYSRIFILVIVLKEILFLATVQRTEIRSRYVLSDPLQWPMISRERTRSCSF